MTREEVIANAQKCGIPDHMHEGLAAYIVNHREPGGFLGAVLRNNLTAAAGKADHINQHHLYNYAVFLFNYAPAYCWGSNEAVERWLNQ